MPAPIPLPVRQVIFKRWRKGESVAILAEELKLSVRTVQHLVRRFAARGQSGVEPDYAHCATNKLPTDADPFQKAMQMRQQHPGWGSGLIRVVLQEQGDEGLSQRTNLATLVSALAVVARTAGRRPASDDQRAGHPHDVWQMDAVDQLPLATGEQVSWLRLVDECSGVVLQTTIFPPALLESGAAHGRAGDVALGFFAVGKAPAFSSRQRHPLGIGGRLAHRTGIVADRPGCGHDLESGSDSSGQWRGRTLARDGQTLDRTGHMQGRRRTATTHGRHGSHST